MFRESKVEDQLKQNLVEKEINTTTNTENSIEDYNKYVYIKIFSVLFIQYIIIFLTSFLGFYFGFNLKLLNLGVHISLSVIQGVILIFFIIIFILKIFFEKNIDYDDNTRYTIIFHICFPFFVIYYAFLLSLIVDYEYIIIGLSIILIEIISILLNAIIFEKFKKRIFVIISSFLNLIALILFYFLWVKNLLSMVYDFSFVVITIGYIILWFYISKEFIEDENYFFSAFLFNYSVYLGLAFALMYMGYFTRFAYHYISIGLKYSYECLCDSFKNLEADTSSREFHVFIKLLIIHTIVTVFVWIGFSFHFNIVFQYLMEKLHLV